MNGCGYNKGTRSVLIVRSCTHLLPAPSAMMSDGALGCVNARSADDKAATLCRIITDEHLNIVAISETWHECSESTLLLFRITTASTLLVATICGPPAAISCLYRGIGVRCWVVGSLL